jgi:tRNA pseudouridine synthase 8/2,5-diamino-6-(5-phospho-D-ribitylamino)-pyrimidin-4(3H)-one deaminase
MVTPLYVTLQLKLTTQRHAIATNKFLINDKPTDTEYMIRGRDHIILEPMMRLEYPILYFDHIEVLKNDQNLFVVNKPSGIAIHPGGPFDRNTLTEILREEYHIGSLKRMLCIS